MYNIGSNIIHLILKHLNSFTLTHLIVFDYDILNTRLRETAFLNAGLKITIVDQRGDSPEIVEHQYDGGISEFVTQLNERRNPIHSDVVHIKGMREIEEPEQ